jgi:uncharacterized membrane protein YfcA
MARVVNRKTTIRGPIENRCGNWARQEGEASDGAGRKKLLRSPWLELSIMSTMIILSYVALMLISGGIETPLGGMTAGEISGLLFGFFLLGFLIAVIAVIAGIGGGVIFTPILLAFTPFNSLVIRATGLIVAMFNGLIATGPFMRRGLGNLKLVAYCCCGYGIGTFMGAQAAISTANQFGISGEGLIRIILGFIILLIVFYFLWGGMKIEWPQVRRVDRFTQRLRLPQPYYEKSLGKVVNYRATRAGLGLLATFGIGIASGFFGLGAGWAIVPIMNLIMGIPLKVAVACSCILIGMGDSIGVWPYMLAGAIIPLFVAPWLAGQVLGGLVGAHLLINIKARFVRFIIIGIMAFSSFGLVTKGLRALGYIPDVPNITYVVVFLAIMIGVVLAIIGKFPRLRGGGIGHEKT